MPNWINKIVGVLGFIASEYITVLFTTRKCREKDMEILRLSEDNDSLRRSIKQMSMQARQREEALAIEHEFSTNKEVGEMDLTEEDRHGGRITG